jgi:hypothetical protein
VQSYLDMLSEDTNSKDMIITALNNLEQMLDYALVVVMGSTKKFIQL